MAPKAKKMTVGNASVEETSGTAFDLDALRQIVELLEASEVTSLDWRRNGERLSIRRGPPPMIAAPALPLSTGVQVVPPSARTTPVTVPPVPQAAANAPVHGDKPGHVVTSPFVGTFYRSPAPDQPAYVEIGAVVKKGQVLCIIEAMKLMNEIEAEVSGKLAEVLVQNGQPVEFGQPLFRLEP